MTETPPETPIDIAVITMDERLDGNPSPSAKTKYQYYNPPGYSIGRNVFLSGILSVLSGGTVNLLTLVTMNIIYINSRC